MNLATQYPDITIKALIIDDQMLMRRAFARILFEMGVESIEECSNAEDGIRKLKRIPEINLVICDLRMERLTGFDVLTYLRTRPIRSDVPFLLVTGDSEQEVIVKAKDLGVSDFGIKPIMPEDIKKKIWKMMESYLNPTEVEKLFQKGDQLFLAGKYQKAMNAYKETAEMEPSARSVYSMAQVLLRANRIDAAFDLVKENIKKYPLYYKNYALAADISILKRDYYTAIDYLKKELNINPWQPHRCCLVGNIYMRLSLFTHAKKQFQKALSYSPKFKDAMWGLANAHYHLDEYEKCFHRLRKLLRYYPKTKKALEMLIELGKVPELNRGVEIFFRDEINRNPGLHSLALYMAKHYYYSRKYEEALQYLGKVLEVYPAHEGVKKLAAQIEKRLPQSKSMAEAVFQATKASSVPSMAI